MFKDYLQIHTVSIVFAGNFNPSIIQPFWLAHRKLVGEKEAESAKIHIVHKQLVRFELDWFFIEVNEGRLELKTNKEPYFEPLKDLAVGIFSWIKETPVVALGINHIFDIALKDSDQNDSVAYNLVNLKSFEDILKKPRLLNLNVVEQQRNDGLNGSYSIRISPSNQTTSKYGLNLNINDNYSLAPGQTGRNGEILKIFSENWGQSNSRAETVVESVWKNFA